MFRDDKISGMTEDVMYFNPDWSDLNHVFTDKEKVFERLHLESSVGERIRQVSINILRSELKHLKVHNLIVRGSVARGDFPCDDVDIFHYGSKSEYKPDTWPTNGITRPINYDHIPIGDLSDCLETSVCMSCATLDGTPVTEIDKPVSDIISKTRSDIFTTRKGYYLLFRLLEEKWNHEQEISISQGYDILKRYPGSKRTIQRIFWVIQVMEPQYNGFISQKSLFLKAREDGLLPDEIVLASETVLKSIKNPKLFSEDNFSRATNIVDDYFQDTLQPETLSNIKEFVPQKYLENIYAAANTLTDSNSLTRVVKDFDNSNPYAKWLLSWTLSGNSSCTSQDLYFLWKNLLGKVSYRCVLQNLLHNPSFPRDKLNETEMEYDPQLLTYWKRINTL